jgi:hypothetical protein
VLADPVVARGLRTLTGLVNHANQLAGSMDRRDATNVLLALHEGGHRLEPEQTCAWTLAQGWPAGGATRLQELATRIAAGQRARADRTALDSDALRRWREEAAKTQP